MSGSAPALSVVLPVYNARPTVGAAVASVLASTFADFELVIVDDGSTDGSVEVLRRLASGEERIRLFERGHCGVAGATNEAVRRARAAWIARMDADDLCLPDRLQWQWDHVMTRGWDGAGGQVEVVDRDGRPVASWRRYARWVNDHLDPASIAAFRFVECPLVNPTMMARREVWDLGCRDGPWPEDYDLWLRALNRGFRFGKVARPVLRWIDHPGRLTRNHPRYARESFDLCRRLHLRNGPLREARAVDLWGAGQTGKPWLRWLLDEGIHVRRVLEVSPRKIGLRLRGVPMVDITDLGAADGTPLIVAVGAEGARERILEHLRPRGFVPGRDAWFVA